MLLAGMPTRQQDGPARRQEATDAARMAYEAAGRPTRRQEASRALRPATWPYGQHIRAGHTSAPSRTPGCQACAFGLGVAFFLALADLVAFAAFVAALAAFVAAMACSLGVIGISICSMLAGRICQ